MFQTYTCPASPSAIGRAADSVIGENPIGLLVVAGIGDPGSCERSAAFISAGIIDPGYSKKPHPILPRHAFLDGNEER
jgi:hypothetical protein